MIPTPPQPSPHARLASLSKEAGLRQLLCILLLVCSTSFALAQNPSSLPTLKDQLPGAWRLVSIETVRPSDEIIYPFYGKHPEGLLVYDRSGWMSVQIVADPKPTVPRTTSREEFLKASPSDKSAAIDGYYAYYGTWTVDESASTVTHHIRQSLMPGERDQDGVRGASLQGNRLTLTAKAHEMGEDHQRRLVWERVVQSR